MRMAIKALCAFYALALTALLLVPDPLGLLGIQRLPGPFAAGFGVHFALFAVLGITVGVLRWPKAGKIELLSLACYAAATETLQIFVRQRSVEALDYFENFAGVALGWAVCWLVCQRLKKQERPPIVSPREGDTYLLIGPRGHGASGMAQP